MLGELMLEGNEGFANKKTMISLAVIPIHIFLPCIC